MTTICGKLCSALLLEHFGEIVQSVGVDLFKQSTKTLGFIRATTHLPLTKVKEALCVLIKFGFVTHKQGEKETEYTLHYDKIIMMLQYPRYMFVVKTICGDEAEIMLEEILKTGYETASQIIIKTHQKLDHLPPERRRSVSELKDKFELLIKNQFVIRNLSVDVVEDNDATQKVNFSLSNLDLEVITQMIQGDTTGDPKDSKIYWNVNFDRFTQHLRDEIMVSSITKRFDDENAGELMRQLLYLMYLRTAPWADTSNPIPFSEIKDVVRKLNYPLLTQYLDQYLRLIEEDSSQFLKRVGDTGGGQFSINMKEAFNQIVWTTVGNIIMERFGSKAARIFRLIRIKKYVEQEQIEQLAMIPAKEAKHLTYTLLEESYLQIQELKKTGVASTLSKSFFLFHINLNQVVRMEIEHCYQALYNTIQRREHESIANRRMIDKQLRIQTLTSNLKEHGATEEQLAEIAEMMTPSEKLQLEKVQNTIKKLAVSELEIEKTLILLTMYLRYH